MSNWLDAQLLALLAFFALPRVGLSTVFVVSVVSATLLPMGSEPVVFAVIKADPALFWPAIAVATLGNTLGGGISLLMPKSATLRSWDLRSNKFNALSSQWMMGWLQLCKEPNALAMGRAQLMTVGHDRRSGWPLCTRLDA